MLFFPIVALVIASAQAAILTLETPKVVVTSATGSQLQSEQISLTQPLSTPVKISKGDKLKLTFQIVEKDDGKGVQPHQTFLRFYDAKSGEEGIQPVRVTNGGKAKFELVRQIISLSRVSNYGQLQDMAKPPVSLPPTSDEPLKVTLLIGSPVHSPLKIEFFDLVVPASQALPVHPEEPNFHPLPEIRHTFRPDQKMPPRPISAIFSAVVAAPWAILLALVSVDTT
ncbi:hypothetical protein C0992_005310 [Termitomyces sp. T32_za158]|nr:hypothetical protein C0992_005310 [Termitomyces sp. T32_za158]